jgi:hypothetical protein
LFEISDVNLPAGATTVLDIEAAERFIKHAIAHAEVAQSPDDHTSAQGASTSHARLPLKVTSKMVEREQYHKGLKEGEEGGEGEEEGLDVFDAPDVQPQSPAEDAAKRKSTYKGKGKANSDGNPYLPQSGAWPALRAPSHSTGNGFLHSLIYFASHPITHRSSYWWKKPQNARRKLARPQTELETQEGKEKGPCFAIADCSIESPIFNVQYNVWCFFDCFYKTNKPLCE